MSLLKIRMLIQGFSLTACHGEMIYKLQEAVIYNEQRQLNVSGTMKGVPNVNLITTKTVQIEIGFRPMSTSDHFLGTYCTTSLRR